MPYEFTAEEFNRFSEEIIKAGGDQATVTTLLADMNGTITEAIARDVASSEKVTTVTAENERLKKANMDLFLRVGAQAAGGGEPDKQTTPETPPSTKTYMETYFSRLDESEKK